MKSCIWNPAIALVRALFVGDVGIVPCIETKGDRTTHCAAIEAIRWSQEENCFLYQRYSVGFRLPNGLLAFYGQNEPSQVTYGATCVWSIPLPELKARAFEVWKRVDQAIVRNLDLLQGNRGIPGDFVPPILLHPATPVPYRDGRKMRRVFTPEFTEDADPQALTPKAAMDAGLVAAITLKAVRAELCSVFLGDLKAWEAVSTESLTNAGLGIELAVSHASFLKVQEEREKFRQGRREAAAAKLAAEAKALADSATKDAPEHRRTNADVVRDICAAADQTPTPEVAVDVASREPVAAPQTPADPQLAAVTPESVEAMASTIAEG